MTDISPPSHEATPSPCNLTASRAVLIGHLAMTVPLLILLSGAIRMAMLAPSIWWLFPIIGSGLACAWWSFAVSRWRKWALERGVSANQLQKSAVATGLVWPKGWIFEKIELKPDKVLHPVFDLLEHWFRGRYALVGIILILLGLAGCAVSVFLTARDLQTAQHPEKEAAVIVDQFMKEMGTGNAKKAHELLSSHAQSQISLSSMQGLKGTEDYAMFDCYEALEVTEASFTRYADSNPELSEESFLRLSGIITYTNGYDGKFEAILQKEKIGWRLHSVHVSTSPEKLDNYLKLKGTGDN